MTTPAPSIDDYLARWNLTADGAPIATRTSLLLPVRFHGTAAMLKVAVDEDERRGNRFMPWWNGEGTAVALAADDDAVLLERLEDEGALAAMARSGADDEASRIICAVAARLHAPRRTTPPPTIPLAAWFTDLVRVADQHGGLFAAAAAAARSLLDDPRDIVVLHGDIHHANILRSPTRGWLAIDPKGVVGERAYDFANIFCNPDPAAAEAPGRLAHMLDVIAAAAQLDRSRLLQWVFAHAGLSAAWLLLDGASPEARLAIAKIAAVELAKA